MDTTTPEIISQDKFYVHSWHCRKPDHNAVGVKEKILSKYSDGSEVWEDNLKIYKDPKRPFWITKEEFKTHQFKKEFEFENKLDKYICYDSQLETTLCKIIGGYNPFRKLFLRQLCNNPYVYGADIETEVLIRQDYTRKQPVGKIAKLTRGGLDIEAEINGEYRINAITFIHEKKIFTTALGDFCKIEKNDGSFIKADKNDCLNKIHELLGYYFKDHEFEIELEIFDKEIDCIKWIFNKIHICKTDFISIWNLKFDIPHIIKRIEALGFKPENIMCHPDVPKEFRFVNFYEDKSEVQHFTDKWHWVTIPGYSQFVDGMCLYARLRKVYGRDSSYSLDAISTKELGVGKLHFGNITNHWYMQHHRFLEYLAYNVNDVIIMQMMELKNSDQLGMLSLIPNSLPSQFAKQTVLVRNNTFEYCKRNGMIIASAGQSMLMDFDKEIPKLGGTVLPPNKGIGVYTNAIEEYDYRTQVVLHVNDLDVSSQYPSTIEAFNLSKQSLLSTVLGINGHPFSDVEIFFSHINSPQINAVFLAQKFYGLPGYQEMEEIVKKEKSWKA